MVGWPLLLDSTLERHHSPINSFILGLLFYFFFSLSSSFSNFLPGQQRVQYRKLPRCDTVAVVAAAAAADSCDDTNPNNDTANGTINPEIEFGVTPNKRLTAERLHKLTSIGFAWSAKHVRKNYNGNYDNYNININNHLHNKTGFPTSMAMAMMTETTTAESAAATTTLDSDPATENYDPSFPPQCGDAHVAAALAVVHASVTMTTGVSTAAMNGAHEHVQDHLQAGRHRQHYPLQHMYYPQQRRHRLNEAQWEGAFFFPLFLVYGAHVMQ